MSSVLVVGGAGYIGSHTLRALLDAGHDAFAFDNLSLGHADAVPEGRLIRGECGDPDTVRDALTAHDIDSVMHFAALAQVGESVAQPLRYWKNNVSATRTLLESMIQCGVKRFIFSSTCATYGEPQYSPMDERHPQAPINPYGETKLAVEMMLANCAAAHKLQYTALRYFNAAGADPDGDLGERHDPETHLIPLVLQVALRQREHISVFGDDYPTRDGTCVRDYIHVCDLADAHIRALTRLEKGGDNRPFNLGTGTGHTVQEVIQVCREVTDYDIPAVVTARRPGDPPELVAQADAAKAELGWTPQRGDLRTIVQDAWRFHESHTNA